MKNLTITVAVIALIAFSLGYFARGAVERTPNISKDPEELTVREHIESPAVQAQTIVRADPSDASALSIENLDYGDVLTTTHSSPRASYVKYKRERYGDFFVINGIGPERAEQIIQDLIDANHYIVQKQDAMIDHHTAEEAELIAQGGVVQINPTAEEKADLKAEKETLYRQIFGEYYEAYEEYNRSYPQRRVVGTFSSGLPEPLEYAAKEAVVQIMYEEQSKLNSKRRSVSAGSGADLTSTPQGWEAEKEKHYEELLARRSFNNRVLDRTRSYLTASQFEQFERLLDDDLQRYELLIEMVELEHAN